MAYYELTPEQALARYHAGEVVILDVRTHPEWVSGHIPGAVHIPMHELPARYQELEPEAELLVICQHGVRSAHAGEWLAEYQDFERVFNVRYGMSAWPGPVELGTGAEKN